MSLGEKIAVGGGLPDGVIDITAPPAENLRRVSEAKGTPVAELVVLILDRPRHDNLIRDVRTAGARIRLISDGDVAGVIATARGATGIDLYLGSGGAPEGVLAAAALRSIGGQFHAQAVDNRACGCGRGRTASRGRTGRRGCAASR